MKRHNAKEKIYQIVRQLGMAADKDETLKIKSITGGLSLVQYVEQYINIIEDETRKNMENATRLAAENEFKCAYKEGIKDGIAIGYRLGCNE